MQSTVARRGWGAAMAAIVLIAAVLTTIPAGAVTVIGGSVELASRSLDGDGGNRWMWEFGWHGGPWRLAVERTIAVIEDEWKTQVSPDFGVLVRWRRF